jgi:aspartyl/asparaginyl beta-hydroxylase (cupin superfamily)
LTGGTANTSSPAIAGPIYHPPSAYPVLDTVQARWEAIRDEVLGALQAGGPFGAIGDDRVQPDMWSVLPLLPEPEDRLVFPDWEQSRRFVPRTWELLQALPALQGYTVSRLRPGGYIAPHVHENRFVTAILTLQAGPACYMLADGERRDFRPGELTIFDYRRLHQARNFAPADFLALLMLLDPAPM